MSNALSVETIFPCENNLSALIILTPVPTEKAEFVFVSPDVCAPEAFITWYNNVSKFALSLLKPVVLTLAKLLQLLAFYYFEHLNQFLQRALH